MAAEILLKLPNVSLCATQEDSAPAELARGWLTISRSTEIEGFWRAQVEDVFWSLGPSVACLCNNAYTYTFTVPESPGLLLTICLPQDTPAEDLDTLRTVLSSITTFHPGPGAPPEVAGEEAKPSAAGPAAPPAGTSGYDMVAHGVSRGGALLGSGLRWGAQLAGRGLQAGAHLATQAFSPASEAVKVSPGTMAGLERVQRVASGAAQVTGKVAQTVVGAAASVAGHVASALKPAVGSLESATNVDTSGMRTVGHASLGAFMEVWMALEDAGLHVVRSMSDATTKVVGHRYGAEAAQATNISMDAAISAVQAHRNLAFVRPTAFVRKTAIRTIQHKVATDDGQGNVSTVEETTTVVSPAHGLSSTSMQFTATKVKQQPEGGSQLMQQQVTTTHLVETNASNAAAAQASRAEPAQELHQGAYSAPQLVLAGSDTTTPVRASSYYPEVPRHYV